MDFHLQFSFADEHMHSSRSAHTVRLSPREAENIKHDRYFAHRLAWDLLAKNAALTRAISSTNRHLWLLAQLIALYRALRERCLIVSVHL